MSYTKGPWYAKLNPSQGLVISEKTGETISVSYEKNNAHLIASAPDLVEACSSSLEYFYRLQEEGADGFDSVINALEIAIAKAEGRE